MATISTEMSQQTTANVYNDKGSERVLAVSATCSIRPGRGLNISIDISDSDALEGVKEEAAAGRAGHLGEERAKGQELQKAAGLGIPIALPTAQSD